MTPFQLFCTRRGQGRAQLASVPLTLPAQSTIADLVFEPLTPGTGTVDWYGQAGYNYFLNPTGDSLQSELTNWVNVKIYQEVSFSIEPKYEFCEGEEALIAPSIITSNGPVSYLWAFPQGDTHQIQYYQIDSITESQNGSYTILAIDTAACRSVEEMEVEVLRSPEVEIPVLTTACEGDYIEIEPENHFSNGNVHYQWVSPCKTRYYCQRISLKVSQKTKAALMF